MVLLLDSYTRKQIIIIDQSKLGVIVLSHMISTIIIKKRDDRTNSWFSSLFCARIRILYQVLFGLSLRMDVAAYLLLLKAYLY